MSAFVMNFVVYSLAMVGIIAFSLLVFKKSITNKQLTSSTKTMQVEETLQLSPRKTLHIVKVGQEKFLIASDMDKTTFLSKLEMDSKIQENIPKPVKMRRENTTKKPVMRELLAKLATNRG